jgi:hypothetical protein
MIVIIPPNSFKVFSDGTVIGNITDLSKAPSVVIPPEFKAEKPEVPKLGAQHVYHVWCEDLGQFYRLTPGGFTPPFDELPDNVKAAWANFAFSMGFKL